MQALSRGDGPASRYTLLRNTVSIMKIRFFACRSSVTSHCKDLILKMLVKNPAKRITLKEIKTHPWTTNGGKVKLPTEDENCQLVTITEEDVKSCVKTIPKLNTLVRICHFYVDFVDAFIFYHEKAIKAL